MEPLLFFERQQSSDPTNLVLAHDVGLAHYWQAKKQGSDAQAVTHWQKVIANWVMVLENDAYWQAWSGERGEVYGKEITGEHIASVKDKLRETLGGELAEAAHLLAAVTANLHLEAALYLEIESIRFLQKTGGLSLPSGESVCCGPLQAKHWSMESQIAAYFRQQRDFAGNRYDSLEVVLASIPGEDGQPAATVRFPGWQLPLCFSLLGIAWIYLERQQPHHTLSVLADSQCPACRSALESPATLANVHQPVRCRDDCTDFDRFNPAYSAITNGRELHYRHAIELAVCAHLALAYQGLTTTPADVEGSSHHLNAALDIGERIGIHPSLKSALTERLLLWADGLGKAERLDEGIALLETMKGLFGDKLERWQVKLANLLNLRGVKEANAQQWAQAVASLHRACELNAHVPLYRENLVESLKGYANARYEAGDAEGARALLDESIDVGKTPPPVADDSPVFDEPVRSAATEIIWKTNELSNPVLFDKRGLLKLELFDRSGCAVLEQALREAAVLGHSTLEPAALRLALTKVENGEIIRFFEWLNRELPQLMGQPKTTMINAAHQSGDGQINYAPRPLSQFDFRPRMRQILELALELAQYDQAVIGDRHLWYGWLISDSGTEWLRKTGVDVEQLLERVIWE